MPRGNQFRHQVYTAAAPTTPPRLLKLPPSPPAGSDEWNERMRAVGDRLRAAGVSTIYLVHGTFVGSDALGLIDVFTRLYPSLGEYAKPIVKQLVDQVFGESCNYTKEYARCFDEAINPGTETPIAVRRFLWSSQNNHIGRADAAIHLIDEIDRAVGERDGRVLLWGHSHAGNVFALLTNLVGGDAESRARFFKATESYYRRPRLKRNGTSIWQQVRQALEDDTLAFRGEQLDIATFGTPVRYGWETDGYGNLLHFINHRPCEELEAHLASFPPTIEELLQAAGGDYIQQFGIAGTNLIPNVFSWRSQRADRRLGTLLQDNLEPTDLRERLRIGCRVPDEGTVLLVDYGPEEGTIAQHLGGHAVYTRQKYILFHAEALVNEFYPELAAV